MLGAAAAAAAAAASATSQHKMCWGREQQSACMQQLLQFNQLAHLQPPFLPSQLRSFAAADEPSAASAKNAGVMALPRKYYYTAEVVAHCMCTEEVSLLPQQQQQQQEQQQLLLL
ncbi:hypothetical protein Esti_001277 [Eimeria stiedai]